MKNKVTAILSLSVICAAAMFYSLGVSNMPEIKFDIGRNIFETAKKSGAPKYSTGNVAGLVSYGLVELPPDIPALYERHGYEIKAMPLFAFTMYADEESNNGLTVQRASLQFSEDAATSHTSAQAFVEGLIAQFQKGKWKRYIDEFCPAVTGRSSFLDETGDLGRTGFCPLDPQYKLSSEDWIQLMRMTQNYQWIGDGVLARLIIGYSDDIRGISYSISLEFDDLVIKSGYEEKNQERELAEGDAQGWNSTARDRDEKLAHKALIKILEANALRRGDKVIVRSTL